MSKWNQGLFAALWQRSGRGDRRAARSPPPRLAASSRLGPWRLRGSCSALIRCTRPRASCASRYSATPTINSVSPPLTSNANPAQPRPLFPHLPVPLTALVPRENSTRLRRSLEWHRHAPLTPRRNTLAPQRGPSTRTRPFPGRKSQPPSRASFLSPAFGLAGHATTDPILLTTPVQNRHDVPPPVARANRRRRARHLHRQVGPVLPLARHLLALHAADPHPRRDGPLERHRRADPRLPERDRGLLRGPPPRPPRRRRLHAWRGLPRVPHVARGVPQGPRREPRRASFLLPFLHSTLFRPP